MSESPNKTKHTPGPWHIGMKPGPIIYGPKGEQVALPEVLLLEREEGMANARLIASAPPLLEALKSALPYLDDASSSVLRRVHDAILQAEGHHV